VMSQPRLARGVLLEQSSDSKQWSTLARATLFRLGSVSGLIGAEIRYPETRARYLRLHWPKEAGFPEFKEITTRDLAQSPPPRTLVEMKPIEQARRVEGCRVFEISARGYSTAAESLELGLASGERVGVSVLRAEGGDWSSWREAELASSPGARMLTLPIPAPGAVESLMVRVCRNRGVAAALESAALVYESWRLVIDGHGVTRARIEYGSRLPEEVLVPLTRLDKSYEGPAWPLKAQGAEAGDVVRAGLPGTVLAAVEGRLSRLRLLTAEGLLPFEAYRSGPPAPAGKGFHVERRMSQDRKWLEGLELSLEGMELQPESVELLLRGVSFEQDAVIEFEEDSRIGVEASRRVLDRQHWSCQYRDVPCRLSFSLPRAIARRKILVSFRQGGVPAGARSQVLVWRSGREIAFVWPGAGKAPRLVAVPVAASLPVAPAPPGFRDWVRTSKALEGEVSGVAAPSGKEPTAFAGWMLYLSLAAAAGVLVLVIFRALRKREELSGS